MFESEIYENIRHQKIEGNMKKVFFNTWSLNIDKLISETSIYYKKNSGLIFTLILASLMCYGFELFNFNLTIDEELFANQIGPWIYFISQGRWGMYILNAIFVPYTIVPVAPLLFALIFQIVAVLILLESWSIESTLMRSIVGAIGIVFPSTAYIYTFSTINYGIGFGFFCCALSLFFYTRQNKRIRFFAMFPAAFAIALYQGFIPALLSVFLVYLILRYIRTQKFVWMEILNTILISGAAVLIYFIVQKLFTRFLIIPKSTYVSGFFNLSHLRDNLSVILARVLAFALQVYTGDNAVYGIRIAALKYFLLLVLFGIMMSIIAPKSSIINKIWLILFCCGLISLPFLSAIVMDGSIAMRSLVALPIVIMGVIGISAENEYGLLQKMIVLLGWFVVFQFILSANLLFGSSNLALQADRLLAARFIDRVDKAKSEASTEVKYLEIVGYFSRPSTALMPKIETFGASFFEWEEGNPVRIAAFLQTTGYYDLQALPQKRRIQMVEYALAMPEWPQEGSVIVVDDTVLVKFGPYSGTQKMGICSPKEAKSQKFCK
jgi:hypothetical protein